MSHVYPSCTNCLKFLDVSLRACCSAGVSKELGRWGVHVGRLVRLNEAQWVKF